MVISQFTFAGGQINRGLIGRRDLQKYYQGAFLIENFVVKRHGTLEKRHGFKQTYTFGAGVLPCRLIAMTGDNDSCNYLAFSPGKITVFDRAGAQVAEIDSPYETEEVIQALEYAQSGDTMFLASRSVKPKRLRRTSPTAFAIDDMPFDDFLTGGKPTLTLDTKEWTKADSSRERKILYRVGEVIGGKEVRVSDPVEVKVWMPPAEGSFTQITINRNNTDANFEGFNIYRNDGSGWGYIGTTIGTGDDVAKGNAVALTFGVWGGNETEATSSSDSFTHDGDWRPERVIFNPVDWDSVLSVGEDGMVTTAVDSLSIRVDTTFNDGRETTHTGVMVNIYPSDIVADVNGDSDLKDGEARLAEAKARLTDASLWRCSTATWRLGSGSASFVAHVWGVPVEYLKAGGATMEYNLKGASDWQNAFTDDYIQIDYSQSIPDYRQPFEDEGDYPGVVGLFQQRMIWASTNNDPSMFWMSVPGDLGNMGVHKPIQDDDAINAALPLTRGPRILHCVSHKYLVFLCENSECVVMSGGEGLSHKTIRSEQQSYTGSSERVRPLVCGNAILFCDRAGASAREYKYDYSLDAMAGRDVSVLNSEMFGRTGGIVDWTYQMFPDSVVWCVMADGTLGLFCYMPEQDVYAWSQATMPEGWAALSVACGDALEDSDEQEEDMYKLSSLAILGTDAAGNRSLFILDAKNFYDTVDGEEFGVAGRVEFVVPDSQGQLAMNRKRLVMASVRGKRMEGLQIGAVDREGETYGLTSVSEIEGNRRVEAQIAEAQVQGDWAVDASINLVDIGFGKTEVMGVAVWFDAQDL